MILLVVAFVAWYTCILGFHCHSTFVCSQTLWRWGWLYAIAPNLTARQQADQNPPALLHYACFTVVNLQQTWLNIRSLWWQSMIRPCHLQAVFLFLFLYFRDLILGCGGSTGLNELFQKLNLIVCLEGKFQIWGWEIPPPPSWKSGKPLVCSVN